MVRASPRVLAYSNAALQQYTEIGRLQLVMLDLGIGGPVRVYNLWGWPGAQSNTVAANNTSKMLQEVLVDVQSHPELPFIILGDLNATPTKTPPNPRSPTERAHH